MNVNRFKSMAADTVYDFNGVREFRPQTADVTFVALRKVAEHIGDGSTDVFAFPPGTAGTIRVFDNGTLKVLTTDYTRVGDTIDFGASDIPANGNVVEFFETLETWTNLAALGSGNRLPSHNFGGGVYMMADEAVIVELDAWL